MANVQEGMQVTQTNENAEARFFNKLPPHIGFNHRDTLHLLGYKDEDAE